MSFAAIKIERMGALRVWDGRLARPTLLPAAYLHRNPSGRGESHAISGTGH
jgi:hypothetical protein